MVRARGGQPRGQRAQVLGQRQRDPAERRPPHRRARRGGHGPPRLFDRFYQSRSSVAPATGEGGKGLGLAIVKRIVDLHGGWLQVSSEPGHGTVVTVELPAA
ncbi:MAG: hypothetical protein CVU21_11780 [Betaproteobacteria bacterium HGW-Betaproteobacteria-15]|nr:MAG: hypothetical protein CVU21_11780 [Betaproteobacteria bacterium HGW-Betaproteobacteria-15]